MVKRRSGQRSISASGTNIALVIDSNDFIHIVYSDTSQVLHYAISDGTWEYEKFTGPGSASIYGEEPSLALTIETWPAIAYVDGTAIEILPGKLDPIRMTGAFPPSIMKRPPPIHPVVHRYNYQIMT